MLKSAVARVFLFGVAAAALFFVWLYSYGGWYGINVFARRGWTDWHVLDTADAALPSWVKLALAPQPPEAEAGKFEWKEIDKGFDTAELPVMAGGEEVDRILLARVDPNRFRIEVHNAPAGDRELGDWMKMLGAVFVINGSYYARNGTPDTPFLISGVPSGPKDYDAKHGAFVVSKEFTGIRDLQHADWKAIFAHADYGMVSYPLLLDAQGQSRVNADPRWLANRSFVGQDASGRIILGTTKNAFFSLERFALFLKTAPLGLTMALNLDGGPVACQGIALNGFTRDYCGQWETSVRDGKIKMLGSGLGSRRWALPIVLAILPQKS